MTLLTPELLDTKSYGFEKVRYLLQSLGLQEGVLDPADLKVVQRALGANMSVDVGAGRCFIQADSGTRNGFYHEVNDAMINVAVTASNGTNPRIDMVVLEIHDSSDLGSADDVPQLYVVAGTPTAGATLDNRTGAAALPNNAILLADILVPAASSSVVTANIRDRRKWARGAFQRYRLTAADFATASASLVQAIAGGRVECSGLPVVVRANIGVRHSVTNATVFVPPRMDAAVIEGSSANAAWQLQMSPTVSTTLRFNPEIVAVPAAGSHLFDLACAVITAGTMTVTGIASAFSELIVEEVLRQATDNS